MRSIDFNRLSCVLCLLMCAANVMAQHMNAKDAPCQRAGSGAAETQCFIEESQSADKELNSFLAKVQKVLDADEQSRLHLAQRSWAQYRQANCEAERALYNGGSAAAMTYYACLAADTRQRISELNTMYGWVLQKRAPN